METIVNLLFQDDPAERIIEKLSWVDRFVTDTIVRITKLKPNNWSIFELVGIDISKIIGNSIDFIPRWLVNLHQRVKEFVPVFITIGKNIANSIRTGLEEVLLNTINWLVEQINRLPLINMDSVGRSSNGPSARVATDSDFLAGPAGIGLPTNDQPLNVTVKIGDETVEHVVTKALGNSVQYESGIAGLNYSSA